MIISDCHMHSRFSADSQAPMSAMIDAAIQKGLKTICFTEHMDYDYPPQPGEDSLEFLVDMDGYTKCLFDLKERYKNKIEVLYGIELGMMPYLADRYQAVVEKYPFDFIILSIHQVEDKEFWTQDFQRGRTQKEYNERYYQEMLDVVKAYKNYSVLGHLDLIKRYDEAGIYPFENVKPMIEEILKIVIVDGKGIELNTSFHRYGLSDSMPSREILKLYRELGGEIITIGSDSHKPEHLGAYIDEGHEILKSLGYKQFCTFENMKPIFHDL